MSKINFFFLKYEKDQIYKFKDHIMPFNQLILIKPRSSQEGKRTPLS